jgi:hypothetical protein
MALLTIAACEAMQPLETWKAGQVHTIILSEPTSLMVASHLFSAQVATIPNDLGADLYEEPGHGAACSC